MFACQNKWHYARVYIRIFYWFQYENVAEQSSMTEMKRVRSSLFQSLFIGHLLAWMIKIPTQEYWIEKELFSSGDATLFLVSDLSNHRTIKWCISGFIFTVTLFTRLVDVDRTCQISYIIFISEYISNNTCGSLSVRWLFCF